MGSLDSGSGEALTLTEDTDGDAQAEDIIGRATDVLDWFACRGGQHEWMFLESGVFLDRTCLGRCGRTEFSTWRAAADRYVWERYSPAAGAAIRARILEEAAR